MDLPGVAAHAERARVKICGVTRLEDACAAIDAGVDALGFNFWPGSKRFLATSDWLADLPEAVVRVGVFVNADRSLIGGMLDRGLIHAVQLHGDEPVEEIRHWQARGAPVIRAVWLKSENEAFALEGHPADVLLLDTWKESGYGGHGETFPWELARKARQALPDKPLLLAGGLTPDNVREAMLESGVRAVDVAGGVEFQPGIKDIKKMATFINEVKV